MRIPPDLEGKDRVRKHVVFSAEIFKHLQEEANEECAGNFSFLLRRILSERYNLNKKPKK